MPIFHWSGDRLWIESMYAGNWTHQPPPDSLQIAHLERMSESIRRECARAEWRGYLHLAIGLSLLIAVAWIWPVAFWPGATLLIAAGRFLWLYGRDLTSQRRLGEEGRLIEGRIHALRTAMSMHENGVARELIRELTGRMPPSH